MIITEEQYQRFSAEIARRCDVSVIDKDDAAEMAILEAAFDKAREFAKLVGMEDAILSGDSWHENYAVTLAERIYIPNHWTPFSKFVVLIHELMHVFQWRKRQPQSDLPSDVSFAWLYLTWGIARIRLEVEAYRAGQMEFYKFLTGILLGIDAMVKPLEGPAYLLAGADHGESLSRRLLGIAGTAVQAGVEPSTEAARIGVAAVREMFPEMEGSVIG